MSGLKSNLSVTSSIGGGMVVLYVVMAVGVFVGATVLSYNTLLIAFRKKRGMMILFTQACTISTKDFMVLLLLTD